MADSILTLKTTSGFSQAVVDSLESELYDYMSAQDYDSLGRVFAANNMSNPNNSDIQWGTLHTKQGVTESVVKNYINSDGDTNSVLIIWSNGLPRIGLKFRDLYQNSPSISEYVNYIDTSINPPANECLIIPPDFADNLLSFRNVDEYRVCFIDILSGHSVIDTTLSGSINFTEEADNMGEFIMKTKFLDSSEPSKNIDIAALPAGLYFVTIVDKNTDKVIYVKTLNNGLEVIE
jgi:hypothetical protein